MKQVSILRIVVASPGDVQAERVALEEVVAELNRSIAADRGLRIETTRWETDAYPGFHAQGPQGLIDSILRIEECDLLIGIFWKRFGTPVSDAKSGTEHEFRMAYEAWKRNGHPQIMVYFNQKAATPKSSAEAEQWNQVLKFKEDFPKEGLWWPYNGKAQFVNLVREHLTGYIRHNWPLPGTASRGTGVGTSSSVPASNSGSSVSPSPSLQAAAPSNVPGSAASSQTPSTGIEVFFLSTDEDNDLVGRFEKHLAAMQRQGLITTWHRGRMMGGGNIDEEMSKHLNSAKIVLLMISPDFMSSFYFGGSQVDEVMAKRATGTLVIPILLEPADYKDTPFEKLMPLPTNRKFVTEWSNREAAFLEIAKGLRTVVENLKKSNP